MYKTYIEWSGLGYKLIFIIMPICVKLASGYNPFTFPVFRYSQMFADTCL